MGDLYHIPNDDGRTYRLRKFVEYQHEVPSIHYRFLGEWIKKYGYDRETAVDLCWYMSVTYNEITCILLNELGYDPEYTWKKYKDKLNFGSARKYAKNLDLYVPLMNEWWRLTQGMPYEWVLQHRGETGEQTYRNIHAALCRINNVGRFAADLFMECLCYLKDWFGLDVKEPLTLDWKNCANLTSGIFNIFYEDERANEFDKTGKITRADKVELTGDLRIIQKAIGETYPEQDNDITMFIGKICSFRNLFKAARYGGFHHDRELGVIRQYEADFPEYCSLWQKCYDLRKEIFPNHLLGELHGWAGIRKERKKLWLEKGLTGVERESV